MNLNKANGELSVRFRDWPLKLLLSTINFYHYNIGYHHWLFEGIKQRHLSDL